MDFFSVIINQICAICRTAYMKVASCKVCILSFDRIKYSSQLLQIEIPWIHYDAQMIEDVIPTVCN